MNLIESNLYGRLIQGDHVAFEYIFKTYYSYLLNYARQILKNAEMAEEAVENAFISFWENRETIRFSTSVKTYLFTSVYHNCLNYLKHIKVKERYELYFKHHIETDDAGNIISTIYPLYTLIEKELDQALEEAIGKLPSQCRDVFLKSRYDGLSNEEIAIQLGVSVNTVRTQISRALSKLRVSLKEYFPFLFF